MTYLDVDFFVMLYKLKNLNQDINTGCSSSDEYEEQDEKKEHGTIWIEKMLEASYIANV